MSATAHSMKKGGTNPQSRTDEKGNAESETITYEMLQHATAAQVASIASKGIKSAQALETEGTFCSPAATKPGSTVCANGVDVDYGAPDDLTPVARITDSLVFNKMAGVLPVVMERFYATQVPDEEQAKAVLTERAQRSILLCIEPSVLDHYDAGCSWQMFSFPWVEVPLKRIPPQHIKRILVPEHLTVDLSVFSGSIVTQVVPLKEIAFKVESGYVGNKLVTSKGGVYGKTFTLNLPDYHAAVGGLIQSARDSKIAAEKRMIFHVVRLPTPMDMHFENLKRKAQNRTARFPMGLNMEMLAGEQPIPYIGSTESLLENDTIEKGFATILTSLEVCFKRNASAATDTATPATAATTTNANSNAGPFVSNVILSYLFSGRALENRKALEIMNSPATAATSADAVKASAEKPKKDD